MKHELLCMAKHPSRDVFCAIPLGAYLEDHEGPHGWDYEAGKAAVIKGSELDAKLPHLAKRRRALIADSSEGTER